jgi:transposase
MLAADYGGANALQFQILVRRYAGDDARIGIETGAMTPWLVHELRNLGLEVVCLDARHARAALEIQTLLGARLRRHDDAIVQPHPEVRERPDRERSGNEPESFRSSTR